MCGVDREMYWHLISQLRISICTGESSYRVVCVWCCVDEAVVVVELIMLF
jgi:hypothetical protein